MLIVCGLLLVTLTVIGGYSYRNVTQLTQNTRDLASTRDLLDWTGRLIAHLSDAESGRRGYVLTGDARQLDAYQEASERLGHDIEGFSSAIETLARHRGRKQQLLPLIDRRLANLHESVLYFQAHPQDTAAQIRLTQQGKELQDQVRALINEIELEERLKLQTLSQETAAAATRMGREDMLLSFVTIGIVALGLWFVGRVLNERLRIERERERLVAFLQDALANVRTLSGMLPICASCKKVRDDKGYWSQIETYVTQHSLAEFSHGICPDCMKRLYPEFVEEQERAHAAENNLRAPPKPPDNSTESGEE